MGKKYLDIKKDSLEESILDIWQTAAEEAGTKMDGRTRGYKSHRSKLESRRTKREDKTAVGESDAYDNDRFLVKGNKAILDNPRKPSEKSGPNHVWAENEKEALKKFKKGEEVDLDEARQLKDPKKEMLVVKGGKVVAIDKKDAKEYLNKGWEVAESVEIDEAKDHVFRVTSGNKQGNVHAKDEKEAVKKAKAKGMKGDIKVTDMGVYKGQPSLKESVLDVWQTAAEGASYEIGTDEYREYLERLTPGETIEEKKGDKEAYQKFFNSALKKFGVKSPAELKGDKKKEFFDYVDKNWTGDHEEAFEFAKEAKTDSMKEAIAKVWSFSEGELPPALKKAIDDKKKDKEEKDEDKEIKGNKTLTGKKAAVVEVDPEPDLENRKKKKSDNPYH